MTTGFIRTALFGVAAVLATTSIATASQTDGRNQFITIINNTNTTITQLYASFADDTNWGPDRLGSSVLLAGEYYYVDTRTSWDPCYYDIKAVFADGTEARFTNEDVCFTDNFEFTD